MPDITTVSPGLASVSLSPLYTVTPAHRIGAAGANSSPSGRWPTKSGSASTYSANPPLTEYPVFFWSAHRVSQAVMQ